MSIPEKLIQAYKTGYRQFSWVKKINGNAEELRNYFFKSQKNFQGDRFYWQTPDKSLILTGFGNEKTFTDTEASISYLNTFISKEKKQIYQNEEISGTGALLFGAFPFDNRESKIGEWGDMSQGLFYLPTFLITQKGNDQYLTLNFEAETQEDLQQKWQERNDFFKRFNNFPIPGSEKNPITEAIELDVSDWLSLVDETVAELNRNDSLEKVVLARQMKVRGERAFQANTILANLQEQQSNTYFFVLEYKEHVFVGATPERLLKASQNTFSTASIAGSISSGKTKKKDEELGNRLLHDEKNREEHKIVVERIIKEMKQMTSTSIQIQQPKLLKNRDIQHLFLPIEGKRKSGYQFLRGISTLHPTPALGGEPKELAISWIREHEPLTRGLYGAPIGWVSIAEDVGEFAVGIRSAMIFGDTGYLYAGCGIVKNSKADLEREETKVKFQPMLRGIGGGISDQSK